MLQVKEKREKASRTPSDKSLRTNLLRRKKVVDKANKEVNIKPIKKPETKSS
jgi:hypothetical protein